MNVARTCCHVRGSPARETPARQKRRRGNDRAAGKASLIFTGVSSFTMTLFLKGSCTSLRPYPKTGRITPCGSPAAIIAGGPRLLAVVGRAHLRPVAGHPCRIGVPAGSHRAGRPNRRFPRGSRRHGTRLHRERRLHHRGPTPHLRSTGEKAQVHQKIGLSSFFGPPS